MRLSLRQQARKCLQTVEVGNGFGTVQPQRIGIGFSCPPVLSSLLSLYLAMKTSETTCALRGRRKEPAALGRAGARGCREEHPDGAAASRPWRRLPETGAPASHLPPSTSSPAQYTPARTTATISSTVSTDLLAAGMQHFFMRADNALPYISLHL